MNTSEDNHDDLDNGCLMEITGRDKFFTRSLYNTLYGQPQFKMTVVNGKAQTEYLTSKRPSDSQLTGDDLKKCKK